MPHLLMEVMKAAGFLNWVLQHMKHGGHLLAVSLIQETQGTWGAFYGPIK